MAVAAAAAEAGNVTQPRAAVRDASKPLSRRNMVTLNINGHDHSVDVPNDTPLLWVIREHLQMTGTKFGCGAGLCGAVHLNGEAVRSCQTQVSEASGKKITTIEGLDLKANTRCNAPGSPSKSRNAATANPDRSCKRRPCSPKIPTRPRKNSSRTWTATFAVA